jgi:hypothetical protein
VSDGIQTGLPRHERFVAVPACWVCGGRRLARFHENVFDLAAFSEQDPELAEYTGSRLPLVRCRDFGQPSALPRAAGVLRAALRSAMVEYWMASEFESEAKDRLGRLLPGGIRTPAALNLQAYGQRA